jgi:hypothetical protein
MASRGLRITKDVAAAWSDMSCGLMERIDGHEDHAEELKEYVSLGPCWTQPKCIASIKTLLVLLGCKAEPKDA